VLPAVGFRRKAFLTALLVTLTLAVASLGFASVAQAAAAPPSGLRVALLSGGYRYLGSGAQCAPIRERVYCSGYAKVKRARFALLMKPGEPERAVIRLNVDPAQRFALERKLDPSGRLQILYGAVWRNYLIVSVGWALSQSAPVGGR
jgi:hypothetical protein